MQLPFKISVLVFVHNEANELLLIERRKSPNFGCWSPVGGKLEMATGESPMQCAIRELFEETGLRVAESDLHLFGYVAEKAYEGDTHWLMFLFDCRVPLSRLPETIDEGRFAFFSREAVEAINVPPTDRVLVWPWWDSHRERFVALRADCSIAGEPRVVVEQSL